MPLSDEQKAALTLLASVPESDAEELASAFHAANTVAAQQLIDQGHGAATAAKSATVRKLERDLAKVMEEKQKAEERLAESDPEKVHAKYREEIAGLTTRHDAELKAEREGRLAEKRSADLSDLKARLAPKLKPMALRAMLMDPEVQSRLQYGDDGSRRVLQLGKEIDYAPPPGTDALDLLAGGIIERVRSIDASDVLSEARGGAGAGNGAGGAGPLTEEELMARKRRSGLFNTQ